MLMNDKQLLTEVILPDQKPLIAEAEKGGSGFYYLKGLFLEGERQNHNGRVYPKDEIEMAVNQLNERIQSTGPIPGELDHPEGLNVNFDRISHLITGMTMEGSNGMGTMKVIKAGLGLIVEGCIQAGMQVGVSSRGSGNIDSNGNVSEFDIVTVDIVANPSAPSAYPTASLAESLGINKHGQEALMLSKVVKNDPSAQQYFEHEITKFLIDVRDTYKWR
jgi:hypothetical protein